MGSEFGQRAEWSHEGSLDWAALGGRDHESLQRWVEDLNRVLREEPALHELDFAPEGFEWVDASDTIQSVLGFLRKSRDARELVLAVCNCTPVPRHNYVVGVPRPGTWREILNSDAQLYGGSGQGNLGGVEAAPLPAHGRMHSLSLTLPPLSVVYLKAIQ
jgi:1,4-alpha-glucan branching enzyme